MRSMPLHGADGGQYAPDTTMPNNSRLRSRACEDPWALLRLLAHKAVDLILLRQDVLLFHFGFDRSKAAF